MRRKPPTIASPRPLPTIVAGLALVLAACNGPGTAEPTDPPGTTIGRDDTEATNTVPATTEADPTDTTNPTGSTPTATTVPSPTAASPTANPSPTPTFTGGINPPTEAPEGFSEFTVPHPDALTEEYAAWVLAEVYRAEDELIRMAVEAPDEDLDELPEDFTTALESLYDGVRLENELEDTLKTIRQPANQEPYHQPPGNTVITNVELLDATQDCLLIRYAEDSRAVVPDAGSPAQLITLLQPKPAIDESGFNRTPWLMVNRAPREDVTGERCPA